MKEQVKDQAIRVAKTLIETRKSKGQVKHTLVTRFNIKPNEAGRVIRTAVRQLYDCDVRDPVFWLLQEGGDATPLQRRFARRKRAQLMKDPSVVRSVEKLLSSRARD